DRAIDRHQVLIVARAVDAEVAVRDAVGIERADRAAADARLQRRQKDRIASVQGELLNLFRLDRPRHLRRRRLDERLAGGDRDRFLEAAQLELRVHGNLTGGAQANAGLDELLETGQLDGDRVRTDRNLRKNVEAR